MTMMTLVSNSFPSPLLFPQQRKNQNPASLSSSASFQHGLQHTCITFLGRHRASPLQDDLALEA